MMSVVSRPCCTVSNAPSETDHCTVTSEGAMFKSEQERMTACSERVIPRLERVNVGLVAMMPKSLAAVPGFPSAPLGPVSPYETKEAASSSALEASVYTCTSNAQAEL